MTDLPPELSELAAAYGVSTQFHDWRGRAVTVPASTVVAVLGALGVDATTPQLAEAARRRHVADRRRRVLPPCLVTRQGRAPLFGAHIHRRATARVWVELEGDDLSRRDVTPSGHRAEPVEVDGVLVEETTYRLPDDLPLGYHTLHAQVGDERTSVPLIVTPARLELPTGAGRAWGFALQLYSVRSRRSWQLGDLADLADLAAWSGRALGAGFCLVNPLHAGQPVPPLEPSPYLPTTRRFVSPLYLRVEDVPECAYLPTGERGAVERLRSRLCDRLANAELLDRDAVWTAKRAALERVHAVPRSPGREAAYRDFVREEGQGLDDWATWCALAEVHGPDWHAWPTELRDPRTAAVADFRAAHADLVDLHRWLQWVLDDQLGRAGSAARDADMELGILHDLAVGAHPDGADAWRLQDVVASGMGVGAPPDAFNQQGQDWSQPPWRPDRLAETGYAAYRDLLRTVLRHAGGLRVDHVLGLFRLWWVPTGAAPPDGTYVRYDHEAMVGVLALEAQRAGAVVIGEDLGTVEPWVRDYLTERGILGTSVLWFERDAQGRPLRPESWRELCLATVTTHDLPPTAGYLAGDHVRLRADLGLLTRPYDEELAVDAADREAWLDLLRERGLLRPGADVRETVEALHRVLTWTPARLLGVALTDAVGERRTQNQPGTSTQYPNWRIPLSGPDGRPLLLEDVAASERVRSLVRALQA